MQQLAQSSRKRPGEEIKLGSEAGVHSRQGAWDRHDKRIIISLDRNTSLPHPASAPAGPEMAWGTLPVSCWAGSFSVQQLPLLHPPMFSASSSLGRSGFRIAYCWPELGSQHLSWSALFSSPTVQGALFGIMKTFSMIFHWSALGTFVWPVPKDETGSYGYKGSICSWKVLASKPHAQIPVWQASCMEAQGASPTGLG